MLLILLLFLVCWLYGVENIVAFVSSSHPVKCFTTDPFKQSIFSSMKRVTSLQAPFFWRVTLFGFVYCFHYIFGPQCAVRGFAGLNSRMFKKHKNSVAKKIRSFLNPKKQSTMDFHRDKDHHNQMDPQATVWRPAVRFYQRDVQVYTAPFDMKEDGTNYLYRAQVTLSRNLNDNTLCLFFFERDASNDSFPKLVIPLGTVGDKRLAKVSEKTSTSLHGKITLFTIVSVNMTFTTKPMKVTLYMPIKDMLQLDQAMSSAVEKWPEQEALVRYS
jgi:hypothetical protein